MSWRNLFKSSHTLWLEDLIRRNEAINKEAIAVLQDHHDKELARMESAHVAETKRVIQENQKLRDELERTRLLLTPALQSVTLRHEQDNESPPKPLEDVYRGTPFQRLRAQMIAEQEATAATVKNYTKPVGAPVKGEHHGDAGRQGELAS